MPMRSAAWMQAGGIAVTLLSAAVGWAADTTSLSTRDIVQRDEYRYLGDDLSTALEMRLIDVRGQVRRSEVLVYRKTTRGLAKTLTKFLHPTDIKDAGTLTEEVKGHTDIQYLYLPETKKLRQIVGKDEPWMESDLSYEDLQRLKLDDYEYELLGVEVVDGHECYVCALRPVSPEKSTYGKQVRWIRTDNFCSIKLTFYDKRETLIKVEHATDLRETNGALYAWHITMEHVREHHRTELNRRWILLNTQMPDEILTTRHLRRSIDVYEHPANLWSLWEETFYQSDHENP